jgi:hypothetical protein
MEYHDHNVFHGGGNGHPRVALKPHEPLAFWVDPAGAATPDDRPLRGVVKGDNSPNAHDVVYARRVPPRSTT